jgi:hypothetical protein
MSHVKRLLQSGTADHGLGRLNSPPPRRALVRALETSGDKFGMSFARLDAMPMKDLR